MKRKAFIECGSDKLYLLFSILKYNYLPLLFVVENERRELYLGLCAESRGFMRWTLAKTTIKTIENLLDQKLTINDALGQDNGNVKLVEFHRETGFSCELGNVATISPYDLTRPGTLAKYVEDDVDEKFEAYKQRYHQEVEQYRTEENDRTSEGNRASISTGNRYVMSAEKMERLVSHILDLYMASDSHERTFSDYCLEMDRPERSVVVPIRCDDSAETTTVKDKDIDLTLLAIA